jgi:acylphosphatase
MKPVYTGSMTIARRIRIEGRVQRVFFRDWTVATASALGLTGWVRNCHDRSVEALAIGEEAAIVRLIVACHDGPELARVDRVTVEEAAIETFARFDRRSDA